jgi:hypothetical protein
MENTAQLIQAFAWLIPVLILATAWDTAWKLIGMWKAGRNNELGWFICIALFNTLGILPIIYIILSKKKAEQQQE